MSNPLSPPVKNYSIVIDNTTVTAFGVRKNVTTDIDDGEYTIMVIANNDIGPSIESMPLDIGKV